MNNLVIQDISVLKVASIQNFEVNRTEKEEVAELKQLDFVDGVFPSFVFFYNGTWFDDLTGPLSLGELIGSVRIDEAFRAEVAKRLSLVHDDDEDVRVSKYAAHDMAKTRFQSIKTNFGTEMQEKAGGDIILRVPDLPRDFNHAEAKISNGKMIFTK